LQDIKPSIQPSNVGMVAVSASALDSCWGSGNLLPTSSIFVSIFVCVVKGFVRDEEPGLA